MPAFWEAHAYAGALSQVAGQPPHVSPSQAKAQQLPQQPLQAHHMPRMPQHTVPQQQMSQPTQHSRLHASGTNPAAPSRTHQVQMAGSRHGEQTSNAAEISVAALASLWTKPSARGEPIPQGETTEEAPGITVGQVNVSGVICTRATWKIEDVRDKLQATLGRPLVSPPFRARGLPNLRLMVFPDAREAAKGVRQRERKGLYATMVKKGPVHGSLCLKADCLQDGATVLCYNLTVGKERRGPFTYDYKEKAVNGCEDFGIDWLKEIDDWEALDVGVEILDVIDKSERQAYPLRAGQRSWQDGHFGAESYENYAAMKLGVIQRDLFAVVLCKGLMSKFGAPEVLDLLRVSEEDSTVAVFGPDAGRGQDSDPLAMERRPLEELGAFASLDHLSAESAFTIRTAMYPKSNQEAQTKKSSIKPGLDMPGTRQLREP
ncbi:RNF122 [Symbiodinium sp. CCMP2592]|nr:RNF122 [Symbiodinium sp. CCMP2592]